MVFLVALGLLAGAAWLQLQPALMPAGFFIAPVVGAAGLAALFGFLTRRALRANSSRIGLITKSLLVLALFFLYAFMAAGYATIRAQHALDSRLPPALDRQSLQLEVVVMDLPAQDAKSLRFEVMVQSAQSLKPHRRVITGFPKHGVVHWYFNDQEATPETPKPGEVWRLQARVRQPSGTLNPGGFDYEAWMLEKGMSFNATVQQGKRYGPPEKLGQAEIGRAEIGQLEGWQIAIDRLRDQIRQRINKALPGWESRHVLVALVVGDQRAISTADWAVFQRTGVSHLMSISGLHVTMLAALSGWIGALCWRMLSRTPLAVGLWLPVQSVGALFAIIGAFGYAMLAGFAIPAQRTAWMVAIVSAAKLFGVRANPWASLSIALIVVLLSDPMAVLAPGFWLSFMAVGFLFTLPDLQQKHLNKTLREKMTAVARQAGHAQLAITFGLLPVTVLMFQQIVLVGPLANALAIPVVSYLVTPFAMAGFVLSEFFEINAVLIAAAAIQHALHDFLLWCASLSFAAIDWPSLGVTRTVIASLGMVVALGAVLPPSWSRWRHLGWLSLAALWGVAPAPPAYGDMAVSVIDVGQGTSILIRTHSHTLLYDTGPALGSADAGARMIMPVLRRKGIRVLDQVMVSHADNDHAGGLPSIAELIEVRQLKTSWPSELAISPTSRNPALAASPCIAGQAWQWDGVRFEVLHPQQGSKKASVLIEPQFDYLPQAWPRQPPKPDRNAHSCVLRVQDSHGASILLTGDIPIKQEKTLPLSHTQVLMAPHHGSKTSTGIGLLTATQPELVVIQAGYRNRFGHPHAEVLNRIEAFGSKVLRTDLQGAIDIEWQSGRRSVQDFWQGHRRYWHLSRNAQGDPTQDFAQPY